MMTDQSMRMPDPREPSARTVPRDPGEPADDERERFREEPLLREGADAPDAADIEDPEHQR
jgi:hypothetical protein